MSQERQSTATEQESKARQKRSKHRDGIYIFVAGKALRGPFDQWGKWKTNLAYAMGYIDGMKSANPTFYDRLYLVEIQHGQERIMERDK